MLVLVKVKNILVCYKYFLFMIQVIAKLFDFIENGVYLCSRGEKQTHIAPHDKSFVTELMGVWLLSHPYLKLKFRDLCFTVCA